jgi:hypothetical protein
MTDGGVGGSARSLAETWAARRRILEGLPLDGDRAVATLTCDDVLQIVTVVRLQRLGDEAPVQRIAVRAAGVQHQHTGATPGPVHPTVGRHRGDWRHAW